MKSFGWGMQYSVFVCDLDTMELIGLKDKLGRDMKHDEDSLAFVDCGPPAERGRASFAFMGVANWYVAFHYSEQTWVMYKVWGGMGLFLVFAVAQGLWLSRYVTEGTA